MTAWSRRALLAGLTSVSAAAMVGCSSDSSFKEAAPATTGSTSSTGSASSVSSTEAVFPATITHKFGSTTVEKKPQRVAVVGYSDQDFVLAFGVKPVLVRSWYGPNEVLMPWTKGYADGLNLTGADLGSDGIDIEKVAAVNPDLIIAVYSGITKADYDKLSKLAPVIAQEADFIDYGQPWQNVTRQIGTALGQPEKAKQLVSELEAKLAKAKADHPEWSGKKVTVATFDGANSLNAFATQDARLRFFTALGFTANAEIDKLAGTKFYAKVPLEKAAVLDTDLLIWDQLSYTKGGQATIDATPALANLKAMKDKRAAYLAPVNVEKAFAWQTVLSLPFALDTIVKLSEKAAPRT